MSSSRTTSPHGSTSSSSSDQTKRRSLSRKTSRPKIDDEKSTAKEEKLEGHSISYIEFVTPQVLLSLPVGSSTGTCSIAPWKTSKKKAHTAIVRVSLYGGQAPTAEGNCKNCITFKLPTNEPKEVKAELWVSGEGKHVSGVSSQYWIPLDENESFCYVKDDEILASSSGTVILEGFVA